jgi:ABC-type spermidine/putrescine transport system permease subunit II
VTAPQADDAFEPTQSEGSRWAVNRWALVVLPGIALLGVFFVYPGVQILIRSVSEFTPPEASGLDNFAWFFASKTNVTILIRTLETAFLVTAVCLLVGYPYAYVLTIVGRRVRMVLLAALVIAEFSSLLVRSYAWVILLQANGPINDVLAALGLERVELTGTTFGVVIAMAQIFAPLMILPVYANMQGIDRRLLGAAQSLGASPVSAFRQAYFPLSLPGILAGSLLVFVLTLGFFITPTLVGSPRNALVSQLVVTQVDQLLAFGRAGAMSVILLAITLLLVAVVAFGSRRRLELASGHGGGGLGEDVGWRRPGRVLLAAVAAFGAAWLIVPGLIVVPISFAGEASLAFPPESLSTRWYSNFFTNSEWTDATLTTLKVGALTTIVATAVGTATAFGMVRGRFPGKAVVNALILSPMIVPLVVTAIAIYSVFLKWHVVGTTLGLVAAHTVLALPFVVVTVGASLRSFDVRLEDAAASLGASPWRTLWQVTLPGIRAGVLGGALFAFATSFDEVAVSLFLTTADLQTLPVQIFNGINRQIDPTIAVVSSLILALTVVGFVIGSAAQRRFSHA